MFGKRRLSAMAAVVALAAMAGALGGALATAGLQHFAGDDAAPVEQPRARSLRGADRRRHPGAEGRRRTYLQTRHGQFNKTSDRLDKVEKAQAEPAAKLAKLSEAVEKLRAAPVPPGAARRAGRGEGRHRLDLAAGDVAAPVPLPRPRPKWPGCRRSKAGCCATSPMAAR